MSRRALRILPCLALMLRTTIFAVLLLGAFGGAVTVAAQDLDNMPSFEEVLSLESVGAVAISPDGSAVAYTVRVTDWEENGYDTEIWLAGEGESLQLTRTSKGSSNSPAWSPDGRWITFLADRGEGRQVFAISRRGGEARALTAVDGGVSTYAWSPDGSRLALGVREPEADDAKARSERYGAFTVEDSEYRMTHLWTVDVSEDGVPPDAERLTEGDFTVSSYAWSPDGSRIAFDRAPDTNISSFMNSDVYLVSVDTKDMTPLVDGAGPDAGPVWSPDGEWILFSEYDGDMNSVFYLNGELAKIPAGGGDITVLTEGWDENPGAPAWTAEGVFFVASDRTERQFFSLDPNSGQVERLDVTLPIVGAWDMTPDGRTAAFTAQGAETLSEVFLVEDFPQSSSRSRPQKLTNMSAQIEEWTLGTREVIQWRSEDGAEIEGVLFKPADYDPDKRYPLLVNIHGGPTGTSRPTAVATYVYPIVHWLAKGAVVLQPNYRGSAGYGEDFRSLNVRNLGVGDMWDVMSGVQHLIDEGIADPDRLGSMGWSQGGYISAFLTTNTDQFKAISVGAGISNWMTYYVNTDIHPFTRQYLKGTPWDDPEIYAKTSPMTHIMDAVTPTLIQHGEFDRRVPTPNAYELYQGLQDQGVDTRLIVYAGFGHGISKPKELLAGVWHNWQWFAKYIWGEDIELPIDIDSGGEDGISQGSN